MNISIFVRGRVNIIRWIWFVPLRLLREIVWNQWCVWNAAHCLITLVSYSYQINLFVQVQSGRTILSLSFTYTVSSRTQKLSFVSLPVCCFTVIFNWELPSTDTAFRCWRLSRFTGAVGSSSENRNRWLSCLMPASLTFRLLLPSVKHFQSTDRMFVVCRYAFNSSLSLCSGDDSVTAWVGLQRKIQLPSGESLNNDPRAHLWKFVIQETWSQIQTIINVSIIKSFTRSVEALGTTGDGLRNVLEWEHTDYFRYVHEAARSAVCDGFYS